MTAPTGYGGRFLPKQDFEGDDHTPGALGHWVTCVDSAVGRMVSWATNGRIDKDGSVYRSNLTPPDPDGLTLSQAVIEVSRVAKLRLVLPHWGQREVLANLVQGHGLIITGVYSTIPAEYRYQASADFSHAMFVCYIDSTGLYGRLYDPLDRNLGHYGRWVPMTILFPFIKSGNYRVGYVPLEPLVVAKPIDIMVPPKATPSKTTSLNDPLNPYPNQDARSKALPE